MEMGVGGWMDGEGNGKEGLEKLLGNVKSLIAFVFTLSNRATVKPYIKYQKILLLSQFILKWP